MRYTVNVFTDGARIRVTDVSAEYGDEAAMVVRNMLSADAARGARWIARPSAEIMKGTFDR